MPFLIEISKDQNFLVQKEQLLSSRLAPYAGSISTVNQKEFRIYYTTCLTRNENLLVDHDERPKIKIFFNESKFKIHSDSMNTFPLWCLHYNQNIYISSEVKSFSILQNFDYKFKNEEDISLNFKKDPFYSPYKNIENITQFLVNYELSQVHFSDKDQLNFKNENSVKNYYIAKNIFQETILEQFENVPNHSPIYSLLSGGIDSSLASAVVQKKHKKLRAYSLASKLGNELHAATNVANYLNIELEAITVNEEDLFQNIKDSILYNEVIDGLSAEILGQIYSITKNIPSHSMVTTGYGADLLFGGMLKHEVYLNAVGCGSTKDLIQRTFWTGELRPMIFMAKNQVPFHFYWDFNFIQKSLLIDDELSSGNEFEKILLRKTAIETGLLNKELAFSQKIGLTDGTKAHLIFSKLLKLPPGHHYKEKTLWTIKYLKEQLKGLCQ